MKKKGIDRRDFLRLTSQAAITGAIASVAGPLLSCSPKRLVDQVLGQLDEPAVVGSKPNILLILADDLARGELGCFGQELIQTPHLDAMAATGRKFTSFYSGSSLCAPSRCALMTGLHTGHATIRGNKDGSSLARADVTMAQVLKSAGYATGHFGKWGLGEESDPGAPNSKGFDDFYGVTDQKEAHNQYPPHLWHNKTKVVIPENRDCVRGSYPIGCAGGVYQNDVFTAKAKEFIRASKDGPFFLYLGYTIPHLDHVVPSDSPYSSKPWTQQQKNYAAMITRMDTQIGELMALISRLGLEGDTLVLFASDNGGAITPVNNDYLFKSGGPLRGHKRDLYEGGIRVPMIARWPGKVPAGTTNPQPFALWDFFPTAARLAGATAPSNDGIAMVRALLGQDGQVMHPYLYLELAGTTSQQAVRRGKWKLLRFDRDDRRVELYDLNADIGEKSNLAAANPDIVRELLALMDEAHEDSAEFPL